MVLVALLEDKDLDLEVVPPGLLAFTAVSLGNAVTPTDGHAEDFAAAVKAFELGAAQSAELEPLLLRHFVTAFDATSDTLAAETVQLNKDLVNGTQVLHDLDALFGAPAPPPPAPKPTGGGGGSGTGGGGGGTGNNLGLECDENGCWFRRK
jgi:hypothetical protein